MATIRSADYGIEVKRLMNTDDIKRMAFEINQGMFYGKIKDLDLHAPSMRWMMTINKQYNKASGEHGQFIGSCSEAVCKLIIKANNHAMERMKKAAV